MQIGRSAITGRFWSKKRATRRSDVAVVEHIRTRKDKEDELADFVEWYWDNYQKMPLEPEVETAGRAMAESLAEQFLRDKDLGWKGGD